MTPIRYQLGRCVAWAQLRPARAFLNKLGDDAMPAFLTIKAEPADAAQKSLAHVGKGPSLAEAMHAAWFSWLHTMNPMLAARLHEQAQKPFSIWPVVRNGTELEVDIGILSWPLYEALKEQGEGWLPTTEFGRGMFQVGSLQMWVKEANLTEWMREETILDLALSVPDRCQHMTFYFLTPTSFRQRGSQLLWPEPRNVWGSLLRRWNQFSAVQFPPGLENEVAQVEVSAYQLKTRAVRFSNYLVIGFVGYTTYRIPPGLSSVFWQPLFALAYYAKFAGVGYKPTMGLGRTIWKEGEELERRMLTQGKEADVANPWA